ncbi:MAG: exosortase-associated protein EpsI, B-type [Methylophilaceae bacterium]
MKVPNKSLWIGLALIAAFWVAIVLKPTQLTAALGPKVNLEQMIPEQFGKWKVDKSIVPVEVSPDIKESLDKLYSQVLSKTYINEDGKRIMLSISYGGNQGNDEYQVHRPEYCYVAQGFELQDVGEQLLQLSGAKIAVRRLEAKQGARIEPITYWITIGDQATLPGLRRKIAQLKYGLTGKIPDGMLVRVSSISSNRQEAYQLQDSFINQMLDVVSPEYRSKIIGKF